MCCDMIGAATLAEVLRATLLAAAAAVMLACSNRSFTRLQECSYTTAEDTTSKLRSCS